MDEIAEMCTKLRLWPHAVAHDTREAARDVLEHVSDIVGCSNAVLVLEDPDEPWLLVASWRAGTFEWREEEELAFESLVAASLTERSFFVEYDGREATVHFAWEMPEPVSRPIDRHLARSLGSPVLTMPLATGSIRGRLFAGGVQAGREAVLALAEPLAVIIALRFDAAAQRRAGIREAVEQDRIRVARDLHDGLLQSFTGVVLQLETIHSMLGEQPEAARRLITHTQGLIMSDQRELRRFVEELRPRPTRRETKFDFSARLEELRERFAKQWKTNVVYDVQNIDPLVSAFLGQETFRLIHEAVTNSAKHGAASEVRVGVRTAGSDMHIEVTDNGTGFPFQGRMSIEQMRESGSGPTVLAERVASLNGTLTVDSTESGATVTICVPLGWGGPS